MKHFKWEPRGKRRIHVKPNAAEIGACRPWLETEIALVKPRVLVCLGAVAAQALLGRGLQGVAASAASSSTRRWRRASSPPSIPRPFCARRDDDSRREAMEQFVADLRIVAAEIARRDATGRES